MWVLSPFDCHPAVKLSLSGLFSSVKVAGPDLVIAKISAISVFFGSNFAWDFPVSVEFPAESSFWSFQILTVAWTWKDKIKPWSWIFLCDFLKYTLDTSLDFTWQITLCWRRRWAHRLSSWPSLLLVPLAVVEESGGMCSPALWEQVCSSQTWPLSGLVICLLLLWIPPSLWEEQDW